MAVFGISLSISTRSGGPVRVVAEAVQADGWGRAFDRARRCGDLMGALGVGDVGATADRYAMFALLFDPDRAEDLHRFLADSIEPLLAHDQRRHTRLVATLTTYFEHLGHLTRTAAALHVHVNTLLKRLDRVDAVLGPTWREPTRALQLQVALQLHALRSRESGEDG